MGAGTWILDATLGGLLLIPVAAAIAVFRSRRRTRAAGASATSWAAAALVVARAWLAFLAVAFVWTTVSGPGGAERVLVDGITRNHETRAMTVEAETSDRQVLCPTRQVQEIDGSSLIYTPCRAAKAVADAKPRNAKLAEFRLDVRVDSPTVADHRTFDALSIVGLLLVVLGAVAVERMLSRVVKRQPFAMENVRWLRVIAVVVALHGWVVPTLAYRFGDALVLRQTALGSGEFSTVHRVGENTGGLAPLLLALLVFVLAEVWRFGIRLQDDVEATV